MAGTLPGVECARRRRSGGWSDSPAAPMAHGTRRSSFCLYAPKSETHHLNPTSSVQRSTVYQAYQDEKLGGATREAKERLDERLNTRKKSEPRRQISKEKGRKGIADMAEFPPARVIGLKEEDEKKKKKTKKKKGGRGNGEPRGRFNWVKVMMMRRKESEQQDECSVCLEGFEPGETLAHLPCAHRFHSRCLVPWLATHAHCPFCRSQILPLGTPPP